jgi:RNA polymerase sigma-70 factor (ECF subfamily)
VLRSIHFFDRVRPIATRYATRVLTSAADADDAVQEAMVKLFARACDYDGARPALAWVLGFVAWECRTIRRRAVRSREDRRETDEAPSDAPTPEEAAIDRDLSAALGEAIGALSSSDADTILAHAHGQRPVGVASATFRKRLQRAIERLRAVWRSADG